MTQVVDASVLVEYLTEGQYVEAAERAVALDRWICAPALIDAEVGQALQLRHNVSFYDGLYVALAEAMDVPLLTADRKLARAPGLRAQVELIAPV